MDIQVGDRVTYKNETKFNVLKKSNSKWKWIRLLSKSI